MLEIEEEKKKNFKVLRKNCTIEELLQKESALLPISPFDVNVNGRYDENDVSNQILPQRDSRNKGRILLEEEVEEEKREMIEEIKS